MTGARQIVRLLASAAVVVVALAAAVGVVEALVAWSAEAAASELRGPRTTSDYGAFLAVALAALAGITALARRAIDLMTRRTPPDRRESDHELARLSNEARTDSLTRLSNRRAFHDDLAAEIKRRNASGSSFSLMAIDLDGLKGINDTQGHQAGDAYIVRLAHAVETAVGSSGTVYRTGGDEFMALLPGGRNLHAIDIAHRIIRTTKTRSGKRALSVGVTESRGTEHRHVLVRQADLALYEAKRSTLGIIPFHPGLKPAETTVEPACDYPPEQRALAAVLARTVDARDPDALGHSENVADLAAAIGSRLGLGGHHLEQLRVAALLHDVGKIGDPDAGEEDDLRHLEAGREILVAAGFDEEAAWVFHQRERCDGTGVPDGLGASEIPLEARIIAVADAFETLTGSRPDREGIPDEQALAEMLEGVGSRFDGACVRSLAELVSDELSESLPGALLSRAADHDSVLQSRTGMP